MELIPDGKAVQRLRQANRWDLRTLAARAQVNPGYLSRIENGKRTNVSTRVLGRIADAFGVPLIALTTAGTAELDAAVKKAAKRRTPVAA